MLYRADDKNPDLKWGRTCRIGLASSEDGINFTRHPTPVLYPDNDPWKKYEWEGGCEDLHIVEGEDGTYYMNYTTWSGSGDTMSVATSRDLIHWTKHGPAFRKGTPENVGGRSGVVISRLVGDRLIAAKINGKYWMYYLAGPGGHWDGHELAISDDGVHWKEYGVVVRPRAGVTWMGTGHIWKASDFDKTHRWVMNYSEWFGGKQDIMFVTSTDLLNWTKVDEKHRFVQDARWYKAKGRWDCIDAIQRPDGSLYGYFTADPDGAKVKYRPCGFGFAESKDGIAWTALPPVEGDISGEFGGIQKIGQKYYILISEGRVAVGDKPEGPFNTQKKNPNVFGAGCDIYFPRFFHTAPGGPLVNHFCTGGTVFAAPLKNVEIDSEGILRLKWWKNNDKLKAKPVATKLVAAGKEFAPSLRMLDTKLELSRTHVIEGTVGQVPPQAAGGGKPGIYFDLGNGQGCCLRLARDTVQFGDIKADGSNFKVLQTSRRDMDPGPVLKFRLVMKGDMMELYVNDYLMNLKRMNCNGQIGLIVADNAAAFKNIKIWQSN